MMPDLGKYAVSVLSAYGASICLLVAIVVLSLLRGRRVRAEMERVERPAAGERGNG
ncbi:MAG: heme exporter protein CcmD [Marinibacterium sp.]|nr:heme exporter protein CcmD [Marinibacterium sp.]